MSSTFNINKKIVWRSDILMRDQSSMKSTRKIQKNRMKCAIIMRRPRPDEEKTRLEVQLR